MSQSYLQLIHKIDEFIRKYYLNKLIRGLIWWVGIFLVCYLTFSVSEYYGYFNITVRGVLFYGFIILQGIAFWFLVGRYVVAYFRLGQTINHQQASIIIGNHFPAVKDKLINTLELKQLAQENPEQKALIEASINQRIANLRPIPFVAAINLSENKKYISYALIPIAVVVLIAFAAPSILTDGTTRIINHQVFYKKKAPFDFHILNKNLTARQGDDLILKLKMTGSQVPEEVYLVDGVNTFKLDKNDIINFSYEFKNIQSSKNFRFQAGEFFSDEYVIEVEKKPALLNYKVALSYPAYLKKQNETLSNPGDLTIPAGTVAKWIFNTDYVSELSLRINDRTQIAKSIQSNQFSIQNSIVKGGTYSLIFKNTPSPVKDSVSYSLNVIADEYPKIEVTERVDSANVNMLYFIGNVSDDHGLTKLKFHYQLLKSADKSRQGKSFSVPIKFNNDVSQSNFFYVWNLKDLGIQAGEEISYYFDIADNDGFKGPKHTQSTQKIYQLATNADQVERVEESKANIESKMQQAIKKADKIQQETKKLSQDLLQQKTLGYEHKKQIENLIAEKKELEKLIQNIQKEGKQNLEQSKELEQQNAALLEKQKQIQDLFENVLDKKTKELLENLQKLLEKNQKQMSQDELQKMQLDNKSLQKELDRILELYKKLAVEQKLNNTINKLEELAQKQEALSKETESKPSAETNSAQEQLKKDFDSIKDDLKEVQEKNELLEKPEDFNIDKKDQQAIDKDLNDSEKQLQNKQKREAAKSQKSASEKMRNLANKMKQSMQGGQEQESLVNEQALKMILKNLLKTSFDQEKLMLDFKNANPDDPNFVKLGQKQLEIKENLKTVEDSLYSLSKLVPQIQSTVNKEIQTINQQLNQAIEQITERKIDEANRSQQFTLTSINNLALMLSEALEQLQNAMKNAKPGGKGGKPKPGLSELSEMQKQLNKNMQQAKDEMQNQGVKPGQKGSQQLSESLAKMAQQQQMIREALQKVNNDLNKDGKGKLGNLEKIMKQMEQTETDLVNRRITNEALTRQEEIQTRLLEAEHANRERELDNKRESKAAKEFLPNYNLILEEYQKLRAKELQQIKTVPPALNYFYKNKITEYFKTLNLGQ